MQAKHIDGTFGDVTPYDEQLMQYMLQRVDVKHVEVFTAEEKEIKRRKKLANKKYGKVPSIKKK